MAPVRPIIGISAESDMVTRYWGSDVHQMVDDDYVLGVLAGGGLALLLPVTEPTDVPELLARVDGLIITGGNDIDPVFYGEDRLEVGQGGTLDRTRDRFDMMLARTAIETGMPLLGICRGHQVINVALGGSLTQHLPDHPDSHKVGEVDQPITVDPNSRLASRFPSLAITNSYHHQAVDRPGDGVIPVAWAADGVIEAIEILDAPHVVSVQWHPEMLLRHDSHRALFQWLCAEATARATPTPAR